MSKVRDISNLSNIIKTDASGNVSFVSGSTTLATLNTSGQLSGSSPVLSSSYAVNATLHNGTASAQFAVTSSNTFTGQQYISNTVVPVNFTDTASLYTDGGLRATKNAYFSSSLYVNGDLIIFGSQSVNYITSSQLNIADNIVTLNTATPTVRFGGIAVQDSGSFGSGLTGNLLWDSQTNNWIYTNPSGSGNYDSAMVMMGPQNSGALGTEVGLTLNAIPKGAGGHHMTSSGIFESGSNVGIGTTSPNEKLQVAGSISATGAATTVFGSSSTLDWYSTGTRVISRGTNATTRGTFSIRVESSDASLSSDVLYFNNLGAAQFSSSVSLGGYLTGQGVNPGGLGGSRYVIDWLSGYMRIFSYGADTSTNGGFVLNSQRSNGTNSTDYLSISSTGAASFSSKLAVGNPISSYANGITVGGTGCGFMMYSSATGNQPNIQIYNSSLYGYGVMGVVSGTGASNGDVYALGWNSGANASFTPILNWTSTGNVGIGTPFVISSYFGSGQTGGVLQVATNVAKTATAASYPVGFFSSNDATYPLGLYIGIITGATTATRQVKLQGTEIGVSPNDIVMQSDGASVLIGTTANPGYKLVLNGQPGANGYTAWSNYSDLRLKENITDLETTNVLDKICAIRPVTFNYNELSKHDEETRARRISGFIAQELMEKFPDMVSTIKIDDTEYYDTNLSNLNLYLVKAIQEQQAQINELKAQING